MDSKLTSSLPSTPLSSYGSIPWDFDEKNCIQALLETKLSMAHISSRSGAGGSRVSYIESWKAIELANAIFGYNGWSSSIVDITPDFIDQENGRYRVGVTAVVKVMLKDGASHEDVGYGMHENRNKGLAIENAKKEAVSDARKRALRLFGNALGNSIYDHDHISKETRNKTKDLNPTKVSYQGLRSSLDQKLLKQTGNQILIGLKNKGKIGGIEQNSEKFENGENEKNEMKMHDSPSQHYHYRPLQNGGVQVVEEYDGSSRGGEPGEREKILPKKHSIGGEMILLATKIEETDKMSLKDTPKTRKYKEDLINEAIATSIKLFEQDIDMDY